MNDPTALVRWIYRAHVRGDVDAILGQLADDVVWDEPDQTPWRGSYTGVRAVAALFDQVEDEWRDWVVRDEVYLAGGDSVVVRGTCYGTFRATGQTMAARFVDIWVVRDDRVIRIERTLDGAAVAEAMALAA